MRPAPSPGSWGRTTASASEDLSCAALLAPGGRLPLPASGALPARSASVAGPARCCRFAASRPAARRQRGPLAPLGPPGWPRRPGECRAFGISGPAGNAFLRQEFFQPRSTRQNTSPGRPRSCGASPAGPSRRMASERQEFPSTSRRWRLTRRWMRGSGCLSRRWRGGPARSTSPQRRPRSGSRQGTRCWARSCTRSSPFLSASPGPRWCAVLGKRSWTASRRSGSDGFSRMSSRSAPMASSSTSPRTRPPTCATSSRTPGRRLRVPQLAFQCRRGGVGCMATGRCGSTSSSALSRTWTSCLTPLSQGRCRPRPPKPSGRCCGGPPYPRVAWEALLAQSGAMPVL